MEVLVLYKFYAHLYVQKLSNISIRDAYKELKELLSVLRSKRRSFQVKMH